MVESSSSHNIYRCLFGRRAGHAAYPIFGFGRWVSALRSILDVRSPIGGRQRREIRNEPVPTVLCCWRVHAWAGRVAADRSGRSRNQPGRRCVRPGLGLERRTESMCVPGSGRKRTRRPGWTRRSRGTRGAWWTWWTWWTWWAGPTRASLDVSDARRATAALAYASHVHASVGGELST